MRLLEIFIPDLIFTHSSQFCNTPHVSKIWFSSQSWLCSFDSKWLNVNKYTYWLIYKTNRGEAFDDENEVSSSTENLSIENKLTEKEAENSQDVIWKRVEQYDGCSISIFCSN